MGKLLRIALLIESSHGFGRKLLQGIAMYAKEHGPWTFYHEERSIDDTMPRGLKAWQPDGVIARVSGPRLIRQIRRLRVPTVDVYEQYLLPHAGRVLVDHEAVVQLAVEHLRERGFQHFAYAGFSKVAWSEERAHRFEKCVAAWGFTPHVYASTSSGKETSLRTVEALALRHERLLANWLRRLPKPVGVMACNDIMASQVLTVCAAQGIDVPDTLSVIGVDNDEVYCDLSTPYLTSVDPNAFQLGYEAAAMLHGMIGKSPQTSLTLIVKPAGVLARQSTDTLAFSDPEIAELVRYIRNHACEGLDMHTLLQKAQISRATLDRHFLQQLGRTPRAEIARIQMQRVRELLATTDLPLKKVAYRTGFSSMSRMHEVFRREMGQTPTEYRRATRRTDFCPPAIGSS